MSEANDSKPAASTEDTLRTTRSVGNDLFEQLRAGRCGSLKLELSLKPPINGWYKPDSLLR